MSDAIRWEKTKVGEQGVLLLEQRTQKNLVAIRSIIPLSKQIEGSMFEQAKPEQPTLFDEKEHD